MGNIQVLNFNKIQSNHSFFYEDKENKTDRYFCSCGQYFERDGSTENLAEINISDEYAVSEKDAEYLENTNDEYIEDFQKLFKDIKIASQDDLICPNCQKNYILPEHKNSLIDLNTYFISGYKTIEDENDLFLYYAKGKTVLNDKESLELKEIHSYIKYNKKKHTLFFKDFAQEEKEFDLDEVIKIVNKFFSDDSKIIINIIELHIYIGQLAKFVSDVKNINIIEELISEIRNRINDAGIENIKKIVSIFFGIIKYSNLSTIALTKGSKFLYDLMKECDIPKPNILRENNITAPIKIFNFLINNYIKKLNEEVNEDNKEMHEFIHESSMRIKVKNTTDYKEGKVIKAAGKYAVLDAIQDGSISKFIFKNIRNFSDYNQLIKYLKFINKQQLIDLMMKIEIDLLISMIDLIYFRDGIDLKEINKLSHILKSYALEKTIEFNPNLKEQKIDYNYLKNFDFSYYDDTLMMIEVLKFDRKREFDKIKTFKKLKEYHNNIVRYFQVATDEEKNSKFRNFVNRFKFLENREDYNGSLELKLISTPKMLIKEGIDMKHSASSYSRRVINENYLIAQIFDRSDDLEKDELTRFTVGFTFDNLHGLEFDQAKSYGNEQGSDKFKKLLMEFLTIKDISFRPIKDLKLRNESYEEQKI